MKKLIAILLMSFILIPCYATGIDIRKEITVQHGGTRMPSATRISADYDNGVITLNVTGYSGDIQVFVSDSQGNIVGFTVSSITGSGVVIMDLGTLAEGNYAINIALDNATYSGNFEI